MKSISKISLFILCVSLLIVALLVSAAAKDEKSKLTIMTYSWPSAEVNAHIAGFIAEHAYGYEVEYTGGSTVPLLLGLRKGDIDFGMESYTENVEAHAQGLASGDFLDLGECYPNAPQGWYVPTYVIEGDEERGIEPMAPNLESILDLKDYWEVFQDPEDPDKGRLYGAPSVWAVADHDAHALEVTGLDEYFNQFDTGSNAGLVASITSHIKKGEPIIFFYWAPTWIMGKYDLTKLEFPPEVQEFYPYSIKAHITANIGLCKKAPRVLSFLTNYQTSMEQQNSMVHFMQRNEEADAEDAAVWFLNKYKELWHSWFPEAFERKKQLIQAVEDALAQA